MLLTVVVSDGRISDVLVSDIGAFDGAVGFEVSDRAASGQRGGN